MIDFHTHPFMIEELVENDPMLEKSIQNVFGLLFPPQPLKTFLLEMDAAGVDRAVLLPIDCTTAHNCIIVSNEQISELVKQNPRFLGFASVDPNLDTAPRQLEKDIRELGLCGLKLDPALQRFHPDDREKAYPVYQACVDLDIPVMIHCGLSWSPNGQEKFAHPLALEEVIQDFPCLNIIIPHFGWPWVDEALILALKYPGIYLDTSIIYSGTPKDALHHVLSEQIGIDVLERSLHYQILFGSNYPRADIRRTVRGIRSLELSASLQEHLYQTNASTLLHLEKGNK
jgi:predicted TIM-barrel fold metal-dependent hydrolase